MQMADKTSGSGVEVITSLTFERWLSIAIGKYRIEKAAIVIRLGA